MALDSGISQVRVKISPERVMSSGTEKWRESRSRVRGKGLLKGNVTLNRVLIKAGK